jgi:hypothetical protein
MRRHILLVVFCVFLAGCAYFEERMDAAGKCAADPSCLQRVQEISKAAKVVGDATGFPWGGTVAGGATAALMLFFARKRKEEK